MCLDVAVDFLACDRDTPSPGNNLGVDAYAPILDSPKLYVVLCIGRCSIHQDKQPSFLPSEWDTRQHPATCRQTTAPELCAAGPLRCFGGGRFHRKNGRASVREGVVHDAL